MSRADRAVRGAQGLRGRLDRRRRVLLRDFLIFELKLLLDSLKGILVSQAALVAVVIDFLRPGGRDRGLFYKVLSFGERLDSWLSLYGVSERAAADPEGLFGVSREGSPTLLGQLEHVVHRIVVGDQPGDGELYGEAAPAASSTPPPPAGYDQPTAGPRAPSAQAAPAAPHAPYTAQGDTTGRSGFEELRVQREPPL